jgi:hypothetical protein
LGALQITTDSNETPHAVTVSKPKSLVNISEGRERAAYGVAGGDYEGAEDAAVLGGV